MTCSKDSEITSQSRLPNLEETGIIIVDHGSRRAESNEMLLEVVAQFAQRAPRAIIEPAHGCDVQPTAECQRLLAGRMSLPDTLARVLETEEPRMSEQIQPNTASPPESKFVDPKEAAKEKREREKEKAKAKKKKLADKKKKKSAKAKSKKK